MTKQKPCCARFASKLHHDQGNLVRLAQRAAAHEQRGRDISKLRRMITEAKEVIAMDKQFIEEHDAMHAGEGES